MTNVAGKETLRGLAVALVAALVVSACTSGRDPNSFGARVAAEGSDVAGIAEKWNNGDEAIADGRELVEEGSENVDDGEELAAQGRKQVRQGDKLIRKGERMKREAEEAYRLRQGS